MNYDNLNPSIKFQKFTVFIVCLLVVGQVWAQFKISKHSINNGGDVSTGPNYKVTGSIGQKEASNSITGGGFSVTGGFWSAGINHDLIFKNDFEQ